MPNAETGPANDVLLTPINWENTKIARVLI